MKTALHLFCLLLIALKTNGQDCRNIFHSRDLQPIVANSILPVHFDTPVYATLVPTNPPPGYFYCGLYEYDGGLSDSAKKKLNLRICRSDAKLYVIDGIKLDSIKNQSKNRGDYCQHCTMPVKDVNSIIFLEHPFNTTDRIYYSRDEFKKFGIRNFPNIWH
jgi:hypothetical protein